MVTFLTEVVRRTPVYVWVLLAVLIKRGMSASKDNVLSFPRMVVFPAVFLVWELFDILSGFAFPVISILALGGMAALGTLVGYALYCRFRRYYQRDGVLYRSGTYLPLVVLAVNFVFKYALNIAMSIDPGVYEILDFNLFYSVLCGFLLGLTMGGIVQAYRAMTVAA